MATSKEIIFDGKGTMSTKKLKSASAKEVASSKTSNKISTPVANVKVVANRKSSNSKRKLRKKGKKILKDAADQYFRDSDKQIDFVLVFDKANVDGENIRREFQNSLMRRGLELEFEESQSMNSRKTFCFVKLHAPHHILAKLAEKYRLKMQIKNIKHPMPMPKSCYERGFLKMFSLPDSYTRSYETHPNYFARYQIKYHDLFIPYSEKTYFDPAHRIMFLWEILCDMNYDKTNVDAVCPGIERLIKQNAYITAYPLHDGGKHCSCRKELDQPTEIWNIRRLLNRYWSSFTFALKHQPTAQIQHYYGMTIAFYFAWLGCYTRALLPAAIVGVLSFLYGIAAVATDPVVKEVCESDKQMCPTCYGCSPWYLSETCVLFKTTSVFANRGMVFYSMFITVWSSWFLVYWKRREAELNWDWQDATICPLTERIRYEYVELAENNRIKNPITDLPEPYVGECTSFGRKLCSRLTVTFVIGVMVFVMSLVIFIRIQIVRHVNRLLEPHVDKEFHSVELFGYRINRADRIVGAISGTIMSALVVLIAYAIYDVIAHSKV